MIIAVGSDHRGTEVRHRLVEMLKSLSHEVIDAGAEDCAAIDYPDVAGAVAELQKTGANVLGVALNRLETRRGGYYYYFHKR